MNRLEELEIAIEGLIGAIFDGAEKLNKGYDDHLKVHNHKEWERLHANDYKYKPAPKPKPRTLEDDMMDAYADLPKELTVTLGTIKKTLSVHYWLGCDTSKTEIDPKTYFVTNPEAAEDYFVDPKAMESQIKNFMRLHAREFKANEKKICNGIIRSWLQYYDWDCKKKIKGKKIDTYAALIEIFGIGPSDIIIRPQDDDKSRKRVMFLIEMDFDGEATGDDGYYLKFMNNKWDINVVSGEGGYE